MDCMVQVMPSDIISTLSQNLRSEWLFYVLYQYGSLLHVRITDGPYVDHAIALRWRLLLKGDVWWPLLSRPCNQEHSENRISCETSLLFVSTKPVLGKLDQIAGLTKLINTALIAIDAMDCTMPCISASSDWKLPLARKQRVIITCISGERSTMLRLPNQTSLNKGF